MTFSEIDFVTIAGGTNDIDSGLILTYCSTIEIKLFLRLLKSYDTLLNLIEPTRVGSESVLRIENTFTNCTPLKSILLDHSLPIRPQKSFNSNLKFKGGK